MALLSEKEMGKEDLAQIENQTRFYREELLVKHFLQRHTEAEPVTQKMVEAYYRANPQQFGAVQVKTFETITTTAEMDSKKRNGLLKRLGQAKFETDWKAFVESLQEEGYSVKYQHAKIKADLLQEPLKQLVLNTKKGDMSPVKYDKVLYVVKVLDETLSEPKALAEVSTDIRKLLSHQQMKKAVKKAAELALNQVVVKKQN